MSRQAPSAFCFRATFPFSLLILSALAHAYSSRGAGAAWRGGRRRPLATGGGIATVTDPAQRASHSPACRCARHVPRPVQKPARCLVVRRRARFWPRMFADAAISLAVLLANAGIGFAALDPSPASVSKSAVPGRLRCAPRPPPSPAMPPSAPASP